MYWVAASVRGTKHARDGVARQDRVLVGTIKGAFIVAMADGVGSAEMGGRGAAIATRQAIDYLARTLGYALSPMDDGVHGHAYCVEREPDRNDLNSIDWPVVIHEALIYAGAEVRNTASRESLPVHDMGTTLTVVAVVGGDVIAGQVGDGLTVVWDSEAGDRAELLCESTHQGLDPSWVATVGQKNVSDHIHVQKASFREGSHLLVASDGIAPLLLTRWIPPTPGPRLLLALERELDLGNCDQGGLARWLRSSIVNERTDDDKTIVLARHTCASASGSRSTRRLAVL